MAPSIPEIVLLVLIFFCVIGLGKLGAISEAIGERRARRFAQREGARRVVDITPGGSRIGAPARAESSGETIDEAVVERIEQRPHDQIHGDQINGDQLPDDQI